MSALAAAKEAGRGALSVIDAACLAQVLLMDRQALRALEGGPSERQCLLGAGHEESEWGEELPKVRYQGTWRVGNLCGQCSHMHSGA